MNGRVVLLCVVAEDAQREAWSAAQSEPYPPRSTAGNKVVSTQGNTSVAAVGDKSLAAPGNKVGFRCRQ